MPAFNLNSDTTVSASTAINTAAVGGTGYLVSQGPTGPNFTNLGTITFTLATGQGGATGIALASGSIDWSAATLDNEGHFTVSSSAAGAFLIAQSAPTTITNAGTISVSAGGSAQGFDLQEGTVTFSGFKAPDITNTGQVAVNGGAAATGFFLGDGGVLMNKGLISVTTTNPGALAHGWWSAFGGIVQNDGQIVVTDNDPNVQSVALHFTSGSMNVQNHGTITADIAIEYLNTTDGDSNVASIDNYGVINGRIVMGAGTFASPLLSRGIANMGVINGDVDLGPGDDRFFGENGTQTGLVSGGLGNDLIRGGAARDSLQGNQGDDSLHGGAGDDIVVGGKDNDQQFGEDGDDIVWGNLGNDTIDGGDGNDQVRGGQGDDVVGGGAGNDFVSGDRGNDTITGGPGADIFHDSQDAGIDRVLDFSLAEGDKVMLDPGTTYTVSQVGADTVIDMGSGNQMILVGVQASSLPAGTIFLG